MGKITGKYVNEKHRSAEAIINTGKVPEEWSNKLKERISLAGKIEGQSKKILKIKERAKKIVLKKIDHLIDYFKKTPLVEDKETKEILLDKLQEVRRLWKGKDWEEIITS